MNICINGESKGISEIKNIHDFLNQYLKGKETKGIAIARNGVIIPRSKWESTPIIENDEIEIVHAVQGG